MNRWNVGRCTEIIQHFCPWIYTTLFGKIDGIEIDGLRKVDRWFGLFRTLQTFRLFEWMKAIQLRRMVNAVLNPTLAQVWPVDLNNATQNSSDGPVTNEWTVLEPLYQFGCFLVASKNLSFRDQGQTVAFHSVSPMPRNWSRWVRVNRRSEWSELNIGQNWHDRDERVDKKKKEKKEEMNE